VTVWRLLWALLGYTVRGRARQRVYIVLGAAAPQQVRDEFDTQVWAIIDVFAPYPRQDRFVVMTAQPGRQR
jgi:hypothetical protein